MTFGREEAILLTSGRDLQRTTAQHRDAEERSKAALIIIALGDDHHFVLAGARTLLQRVPDITLVGESNDRDGALALLERTVPDIAVVDISVQGTRGTELVQRIPQVCPNAGVVALTTREDGDHVQHLIRAGVRGYVLKRSAADNLTHAVLAVARGGMYLDPAIAAKAIGMAARVGGPGDDAQLSGREADVLRLMARGHSNKEIGAQLLISVKSVETYKARALDKLGLRTRADIVRYGIKHGWLDQLC